jgi:hypothetical protein
MKTLPLVTWVCCSLLSAGCFQPLGILGQQDSGPRSDGGLGPTDGGTCLGCIESEACVTGDVASACGIGGDTCAVCGGGQDCSLGQCTDSDGGLLGCSEGPVLPQTLACGFTDGGSTWPPLADCCSTAADCTLGAYEYICCGSIYAVGLSNSALQTFLDARLDWECAGCACAPGGVHTQDGNVVGSFAGVTVACIQGACMTQVTLDGGVGACQPIGNPCVGNPDCCSNNCNNRNGLPGTCCTPGGCP